MSPIFEVLLCVQDSEVDVPAPWVVPEWPPLEVLHLLLVDSLVPPLVVPLAPPLEMV